MSAKKRPITLEGKTIKVPTSCGNIFITLNKNGNGEFQEVRIMLGKSGSCQRGMLEYIGILMSIYLQTDTDTDEKISTIRRHCQDINCGQMFVWENEKYQSCLDLVAELCLEELEAEKEAEKKKKKEISK